VRSSQDALRDPGVLCDTGSVHDDVAALTVDPDARFDDLRRRYEDDESLRMPGTVFSVARGRVETV
jgi:hypothetical protein